VKVIGRQWCRRGRLRRKCQQRRSRDPERSRGLWEADLDFFTSLLWFQTVATNMEDISIALPKSLSHTPASVNTRYFGKPHELPSLVAFLLGSSDYVTAV